MRGREERERCGALGREFIMDPAIGIDSTEMCKRFLSAMDTTFEKWKPKKKYVLEVA